MTIRHLRIFIEVVDSGKMSTAAKTYSSRNRLLAKQLRSLKSTMGALFERLSRKLYITQRVSAPFLCKKCG